MPSALAALVALVAAATPAQAVQHTNIPTAVPSTATPDVVDGTTFAITKVGGRVILGGSFTGVQDRGSDITISRPYILAFDANTGLVDTGFAPLLDNEVTTLLAGPTADTVYVGGKFANVNGVKNPKLVLLNTVTGAVVSTFDSPPFNGMVSSITSAGGRLFVGGLFTTVDTIAHAGLASLNPNTGALDPYLNIHVAGHHNYNGSGANSGVGVKTVVATPDGTKLVAIGNFKTVDGTDRDQVVLISLGATATIADWHTNDFDARCASSVFDSWVRDVAFAPDSSYFVVVTTGGPFSGTLCDTATRWEAGATGVSLKPTWVASTGGDTILSTTITGAAVYVGGHMRWMNNFYGADSAQQGAVARPGLAALDPVSGIPMAWNPGRDPRGYGAASLYATSDGLYVGSDTDFIGQTEYLRGKIAFFPLAGGYTPAAGQVAALPANVFLSGATVEIPPVLYRVNAGGPLVATIDDGPAWAADTINGSPYHNAGGTTTTFGSTITKTHASLAAGTPLALFSDELYDGSAAPEMSWDFPVVSGAQVEVRLFLAERCWCANQPGTRQFDVSIDGLLQDDNLDLSGTFTYNTAGMRTYMVTSDGNIDLDFTHVLNNPTVSAIEIRRIGGTSTTVGLAKRSFDGTVAGPLVQVGAADSTNWATARGAFLVGNKLFYGMSDGTFYKRTFDGDMLGPVQVNNPHSDPVWDGIPTGSGTSVYTGVKSSFYGQIPSLTGMFFNAGKLYYTRSGQQQINWRWFSPDSGIVGPQEFTVTGSTGFSTVNGVFFFSGGSLYFSRTDGKLYTMGWNGAPTGTATAVSGPGIDGFDWRTKAGFIGA